jgi:hypothetical protein
MPGALGVSVSVLVPDIPHEIGAAALSVAILLSSTESWFTALF